MRKSLLKNVISSMIGIIFVASLSLFLPKTTIAADSANGYRPTVKVCPDGSRVTRCVEWGWNCNPTWQDLCTNS
jgi:hypothetical protein